MRQYSSSDMYTIYVTDLHWLHMAPQRMLDIATTCLAQDIKNENLDRKGTRWEDFIKRLTTITPDALHSLRLEYYSIYKAAMSN